MTARIGHRSLTTMFLATVVALAALTGCATGDPAGSATITIPTPTPTPTVVCPMIEGVDLPPECAGYDPEPAMAANDAYRERMDLEPDAASTNAQAVGPVTDRLEALRASGDITVESVHAALERAELGEAQVREDYGRVLFGASGPAGGCIYGELTADAVTVDVGGYILDGGCLPAQ